MPIAVVHAREARLLDPPAARHRVLIVEDDADLRMMLTDALGAAGWDVVVASDAFGAREQLRAHRIDAVLLDIGLPGLSGLHVCREIRRSPPTADLPVILMTGNAGPGTRDAGVRAGASAHLVKPLHLGDLLDHLRIG